MEDIKTILNEYKEETKRHFDVVAENLKSEIQIVAEQVGANTENITNIKEKLEEHDERFNKIDDTLETIKLDIKT